MYGRRYSTSTSATAALPFNETNPTLSPVDDDTERFGAFEASNESVPLLPPTLLEDVRCSICANGTYQTASSHRLPQCLDQPVLACVPGTKHSNASTTARQACIPCGTDVACRVRLQVAERAREEAVRAREEAERRNASTYGTDAASNDSESTAVIIVAVLIILAGICIIMALAHRRHKAARSSIPVNVSNFSVASSVRHQQHRNTMDMYANPAFAGSTGAGKRPDSVHIVNSHGSATSDVAGDTLFVIPLEGDVGGDVSYGALNVSTDRQGSERYRLLHDANGTALPKKNPYVNDEIVDDFEGEGYLQVNGTALPKKNPYVNDEIVDDFEGEGYLQVNGTGALPPNTEQLTYGPLAELAAANGDNGYLNVGVDDGRTLDITPALPQKKAATTSAPKAASTIPALPCKAGATASRQDSTNQQVTKLGPLSDASNYTMHQLDEYTDPSPTTALPPVSHGVSGSRPAKTRDGGYVHDLHASPGGGGVSGQSAPDGAAMPTTPPGTVPLKQSIAIFRM